VSDVAAVSPPASGCHDRLMEEALIEREAELVLLETALERAGDGAGSVVLVSGEAGIGKTTLVRAFVRSASGRARVLVGACDDLLTPRVFGPLRDAVRSGPLADALVTGDRESVLSALLSELSDAARPAALVVEDVHWADDATLDALRFVSRRVGSTSPESSSHQCPQRAETLPAVPGAVAGARWAPGQ